MDSIQAFINEVLNIDATQKWRLPTKDLYEVYLRWCGKNNEKALSQKGLAVRMQEKGYKRGVSNSVRFWLGLGIKPEWLQILQKKSFYCLSSEKKLTNNLLVSRIIFDFSIICE